MFNYFFLSLSCICSCACFKYPVVAPNFGGLPFSAVVHQHILSATSLKLYSLQAYPKVNANALNQLKRFQISDVKVINSRKKMIPWLEAVASSSSYEIDGVFKNCFFTADYAAEFISPNQDPVFFLFSARCREVKIFFNEEVWKEDINKSFPIFHHLFQHFFPYAKFKSK